MSSEAMTNTKAKARVNVRKMAQVAMLGAIAVVLMLFEIPLPSRHPSTRSTSARSRSWWAALPWDRWREWP